MSDLITELTKLRERIDGERTAMLTSLDERGTLSARPLTVLEIDDTGDVWFLVDENADWVAGVDMAPVNVAIVHENEAWVSFAGRAKLERDAARIEQLSSPMTKAFFAKDARPVGLRVATDTIEWWASAGTLTTLFEIGKARLTGGQANVGESGTIDV